MLTVLVAMTLAADPVIAVGGVEALGGPPELGLALSSILEDDLVKATPAARPESEVQAARDGGALARGANRLVVGKVMLMGKTGRFDVHVVDVNTHGSLGAARMTFTAGQWGADRSRLVREICRLAGAPLAGEPATPVYAPELVLAWGAALQAGTDAAIAEVAKKWPDFGPAQRRLKR